METLLKEIIMLCRENSLDENDHRLKEDFDYVNDNGMTDIWNDGQQVGSHYASQDILELIGRHNANLLR